MTLWDDLAAEAAKPGPTMTITKAQFGALLEARPARSEPPTSDAEPLSVRDVYLFEAGVEEGKALARQAGGSPAQPGAADTVATLPPAEPERCCVESGCPHGFVVRGRGPYVGTSADRIRELEAGIRAIANWTGSPATALRLEGLIGEVRDPDEPSIFSLLTGLILHAEAVHSCVHTAAHRVAVGLEAPTREPA